MPNHGRTWTADNHDIFRDGCARNLPGSFVAIDSEFKSAVEIPGNLATHIGQDVARQQGSSPQMRLWG